MRRIKMLNICEGVDVKIHGARDVILASSGGGKSYLMGVIIEETLRQKIPVAMFDPEGEHWPLAEIFPMIIVGKNAPLLAECADLYARLLLDGEWPIIFDFSTLDEDEMVIVFKAIVDAIFKMGMEKKVWCKLVIDEAHEFAPQGQANDSLASCIRIAKRGRKHLIDSLWATQRPASFNKNVYAQCNRFWLGGLKIKTDYTAIKDKLDDAGIDQQTIMQARPGQFYLFNETGKTIALKAKRKQSRDAGAAIEGGLKNFNQMMTEKLARAIKWLNQETEKRQVSKKIKLEEIDKLKQENEKLKKQIERLKKHQEITEVVRPMIKRLR